jgi:putative ABC transport system permease protein
MLSALWSDLRLALRSMARQRTFSLVVIGTLGLGIGANTAMFSLVHAALIKPLPYAEPDRLVLARRLVDGRPQLLNSAPDYYDYQEQVASFSSLAASNSSSRPATIVGGARPERVAALIVSHDLFRTLGVQPVAGRWFTSDEDRDGAPYVVMVGERLAIRRFGSALSAVGRTIGLSGASRTPVSATVVGVMPASYRFLAQADLWVLRRRGNPNDGPNTRMFHNWVLVGRLKPGVSMAHVQRQVDVVAKRLQQQYPASNKTKSMRLEPLQSALLQRQTPMLLVLMGAVGLVLLIACANVAGLLVARGIARRSELAVRAALGASRGRIAAQLLTEGVVLSLLGGLAGVGLAVWLQRLLPVASGLAESGVAPRAIEAPVLLFALGMSILTGVLSGAAPALRASSLRLAASLAPGARATDSKGGSRLRSVLVVGQVALSLFLLVGAGLLMRSLVRLASTDLGFDTRGLLTTTLEAPYSDEAKRIQFQSDVRDELAAIPGVAAVTMTSHVPILHPSGDPPMWAAKRPPADSSQEQTALARVVMPGYFGSLGMRLLSGRDLDSSDRRGSPSVMVVNEAMARAFFPGENPIGQQVMIAGSPPMAFEVVGVVTDARIGGVGYEAYPAVYISSYQRGQPLTNLILRSTAARASLDQAVRRIVAARNPDVAVDPLVSLDEIIGEDLAPQRVTTITLGVFSVVALLLAAMGLYGVLAYYVTQRTHELGVRIALGASTRAVLSHVLCRSALMVGPGLAIGMIAALVGTPVIRASLYEVEPTDPATFVVVALCLAVVAFAASVWPALRAARVSPVQALRGE